MKNKKLRIMHKPNVAMSKPFIVEVNNLEEARKIIDLLNEYDAFQYSNLLDSNDCLLNSNELEQWDEKNKEWVSWCDEETGIDDLDEYFENLDTEE